MSDRLPALLPDDGLANPEAARRSITTYVAALQDQLAAKLGELRRERAERLGDTPLGRTDVAPLVRSLAAFADVIDYGSKALRQVSATARDEIGEEVRATGEVRVVVPDGLGKEVVARVAAPKSRKVDPDALFDALAAIRITEHGRAQQQVGIEHGEPIAELVAEAFRHGYRLALQDVQALTTASGVAGAWSVSKIDGLSRTLMHQGQDDLAGLLDRAMRWEEGDEKVTVTVEDPKARRRG